jgi:hypothetical protein
MRDPANMKNPSKDLRNWKFIQKLQLDQNFLDFMCQILHFI